MAAWLLAALQTDRCAMAGQTNGAAVRRIVGDRRLERPAVFAMLDPVQLLQQICTAQRELADLAGRPRARRLQ